MVVEGKFKVEIVMADTKIPFLGHVLKPSSTTSSGFATTASTGDKTGTVYVEVEPKADYYINIESKSDDPVFASISVDGDDLGYAVGPFFKGDTYLAGLASVDEEGGTMKRALQFVRSHVFPEEEAKKGMTPPMYWTGTVDVSFYDAIPYVNHTPENKRKRQRAFGNTWEGNSKDVGFLVGKMNPDKKKGVMSAAGDTVEYEAADISSEDTSSPTSTTSYAKGGHVKTISMKYCSTLGLIYVGILPRPPLWDLHRMEHPGIFRDHADKIDPTTGTIDLSA